MKRLLRNLSTRRKLSVITVGISGLSLMAAIAVFTVSEWASFRAENARQLTVLAAVIGNSLSQALNRDRKEEAETLLTALQHEPHLLAACLYDTQGKAFASWERGKHKREFVAPRLQPDGTQIHAKTLELFQAIRHESLQIGTLFLETEQESLSDHTKKTAASMVFILCATTGLAWLLARGAGGVIADPIEELADLASRVTKKNDYSARAVKSAADDLGRLSEGFNHLLSRIEQRDGTLLLANSELEFRIEDRTRELTDEIEVRRRNEAALRESEHRFRSLADSLPVLVWMSGTDKLFHYFNRSWLTFTGRSLEAESVNGWLDGVHPDDQARCVQTYLNAFEAHARFQLEYRLRRHDGAYRWMLGAGTPQLSEEGSFAGYIGGSIDIHERREQETQLRLAKEAAESASQVKSEFLATMSHEIRTPMNGVLGFANLLLATPLSEEQGDFVNTIKSSGESLLTLINDILDFSKIEAGKLQLESIPYDLAQVAEEVAALLSARASEKKIALAVQCASGIGREWIGDSLRVRQVLLNLVGNALKFTSQGHVLIEISPAPASASRVRVSIQDTGIGIPSAKRHLLFHKFQQLDSSTHRKFGGTGLGLAICKLLVELMGGEIGVESEPNKGSTFWFELPAPPDSPTSGFLLHPSMELTEKRVLVADGCELHRQVLAFHLQQWGISSFCVANASGALDALRVATRMGEPFEIAIIDSQLPEMEGVRFAQMIRAEDELATTALVLVSSSGSRRNPSPEEPTLFAAILNRPLVRVSQLLGALNRAMEQRRELAPLTTDVPAEGLAVGERLSKRRAETPQQSQNASASNLPPESTAPLRVLLVEDNPANQKLAERLLENQGFQVVIVSNGRLGLERAVAEHFDFIVMDCQMPDMDGFEATAELRRLEMEQGLPGWAPGTHIPVIALTANAIQGDRDRCMEAGMDDYVTKPVSADTLRQAIQQTERVFSTLSGAAIDTVIARDRSALKNIVQGTVIHDREIVLLTLTDSEGEVLVEWGRAHGPDEIRSFSKDLTYQGKRTGTMMMQWDISQRLQPIHSHVGNMRLLVFVSLLILSLVIVALLDRFILQPMKTLNLRLSGPDGQDRGSSRFTALEIVKLHEALSSLKCRVEERTRELRLEVVERKTAETVAQQARLNAEAANQAKSEFLATMSHEIRTPMNAIMGFASILVETPLDAEQLDFVQTIKGSGESLLALLNDVLDFSNIESGHLELENVPFDLPQLTEEVASLLSSRAEDRQIEVATHCDPRLPRHWLGDPIRVRQVLLNLVGNAIKFTDQGHVFIEVTLEHDFHGVPGEIALLKVQDTGIGIAADKQHLLFQKFQQMDSSTTRRFGGTGLGLAISRLLTDLMGGTIGVESELGRGTTFWFTLPITVCGLTPPPPPLGPSIELQRARILVVDDREINRIVLRRQLAEWGLHHECATSGSEALAKLRTSAAFGEPFDIALLDSSLPDRDTMTLAQEIRRDAALHTTGLVFLASASQRTETSIFLSRGFAATLVKPLVRQSALLEVLRKGREQRRKLQADPPTLSSPGGLPNLAQKPRSSFGLPSPDPSPVAQGTDRSLKTQPAARILLVEDNPAGQKLARILLENLGCQVTVATNGRDAVNRALVEAFDLVFMDCEMLECDGFEATHELRRLEKQGTLPRLREGRLPIVALTANAVSGNRTRCLEAGMDDYITKPVSGEDLRQSIHTWVRPTERKTY